MANGEKCKFLYSIWLGWALFSDNKQDLCLFCVIGSEEKSLMIVLGMRKIEEKTSV